jgi:hypothetical protein
MKAWVNRIRDFVAGIGYKRNLLGPVRSMNRRELVLAILTAGQGRPYTPVQIQKVTFLVTENIAGIVNAWPFVQLRPL